MLLKITYIYFLAQLAISWPEKWRVAVRLLSGVTPMAWSAERPVAQQLKL